MHRNYIKCCHDCVDDRYPGCHDHCKKYLDAKAAYEAKKAEIRKAKDANEYLIEVSKKNREEHQKLKKKHITYGGR